jgi:hypothetical protein
MGESARSFEMVESEWQPPADAAVYVVCAACRLSDGTLLIGPRHWDSVMRAAYKNLPLGLRSHDPDDQGFIDQWGRYMSRTEAWKVAEAAGQIRNRCGGDDADGGTLYSENLY